MKTTASAGAVRAALAGAVALSAFLPCVLHAQATDTIPPIIPATVLPLAAPTGAAEIALVIHWLDADRPELYGFGVRARGGRMPLNVQVGYGQPRGPIGGRWLLGASVDASPALVARADAALAAVVGAQLFYDRQPNDVSVRVPLGLRGETTIALGEAVSLSPLGAAGASFGATRLAGWTEYGGVFGEAGVRLTIAGFWAQVGLGIDQRFLGEPDAGGDARFVIRLGYIPPPPRS